MLRSVFCVTLFLTASTYAANDVPTGKLPDALRAETFAIELRIDPRADTLHGVSRIAGEVTAPTSVLYVHGRDLVVERASLTPAHGDPLPLSAEQVHVSGVLKLTAARPIPAGPAKLEIEYTAPFNRQLQGAYKLVYAGESYVMTQMEPLGARLAFPGLDEPAYKRPWDITLIVPQQDQAVANTPLVEESKLADGFKRLRFARTENLPSYLIAFAVGPWDIVEWPAIPANAVRGTPLPLRGIATKGRGKDMRYALEHSAEIVAALEAYFGIPYPFSKLDILAAPDFAAGAMENAGLITYRDSLLFANESSPTALRRAYWSVHAHELAHQWFGDLVTMPWWDDLWLNEAFATWMATRTVNEIKPEFGSLRDKLQGTLAAMVADSLASTRRVREPIHDFTEIAAAFDGITYQKGGAVLAMFEHFIGPEPFRQGIRNYLQEHAGGNATSRDLIAAVARQSHDPEAVVAAFNSFVDQPGVPFLRLQLECAAEQPVRLHYVQSRYLPLGSSASAEQRWGVPLCLRMGNGDAVRQQCSLISASEGNLILDTPTCPDWLMPNAHAAGYYRFALDRTAQDKLRAAFARLDDREQRVYVDSLAAAFDAGTLQPADLLASLPALAKATSRHVVTGLNDQLEWMREHLATDAKTRAALLARVRAVFGPRLRALGIEAAATDNDDTRLLRQSLLNLVADFAHDPELSANLAARGRALFADGHVQPDAVPADLRAIALNMAARHGDTELFKAMANAFRVSTDSVLRGQLLTAMGYFSDPSIAAQARAIALEEGTRSNEVTIVAFSQMQQRALRDDVRAWLRTNHDALLKKGPRGLGGGLVGLDAIGQCSVAAASALEAWHGPRLREVEGGPRRVAQAVERVRLCAALKSEHGKAGLGL